MPNSAETPCARSISRQRTTPSTAGFGPASIIRCKAARCSAFNSGTRPGALPLISPSGPAALNASTQSRTPELVEGLDPDAADPGRFAARTSLIDRRQCQQMPGLVCIARRLGQRAQVLRVVILPKSHRQRHDTLPPYAMVKHTTGPNQQDLVLTQTCVQRTGSATYCRAVRL